MASITVTIKINAQIEPAKPAYSVQYDAAVRRVVIQRQHGGEWLAVADFATWEQALMAFNRLTGREAHTMAKLSMTTWQAADVIGWTITELDDCPYLTKEAALRRILRKYSYDLSPVDFGRLYAKLVEAYEVRSFCGLHIPTGN